MFSTNLRGYSFLSRSKNIVVQQLEDKFVNDKKNENKIFLFDERFDGIQNISFECEDEVDIYLVLNLDVDNKIFLGKTSYRLFLNTSVPLSYPFLNALKPCSYLLAETTKPLKIVYDAIVIKKEVLEEFKQQKFKSSNLYCVSKNELYSYDSFAKIHQPIEIEIEYL